MATLKIAKTIGMTMLVLFAAIAVSGCNGGGTKLGQEIPSGISVTKLSDILQHPTDYNGKTVLLEGIISGQCTSLCEFFFKEGASQATIYPQGYKFTKLAIGKKVKVYTTVTSGADNVVFSALGIKTE